MLRSELADHAGEVGSDEDGEVVGWRPPRWASPVSLVISVLGVAVASYLTYAHYTDVSALACSDKGVVNCAKVTTSAQSRFLGMPVAVLGLAYFVAMAVACMPWAWRRPERIVRFARLAAAGGGVVMILYLIYAELFIIEAICIYCTAVHGLTLVLFVVVAIATVSGTQRVVDDFEELEEDTVDPA